MNILHVGYKPPMQKGLLKISVGDLLLTLRLLGGLYKFL